MVLTKKVGMPPRAIAEKLVESLATPGESDQVGRIAGGS